MIYDHSSIRNAKRNISVIFQFTKRYLVAYPIGSMYAIYGNIYHQYTPNVTIYTSTMDPMGIGYGFPPRSRRSRPGRDRDATVRRSLYWHVLSIAFHVIAWSNFGGSDPDAGLKMVDGGPGG